MKTKMPKAPIKRTKKGGGQGSDRAIAYAVNNATERPKQRRGGYGGLLRG